MKRFLSNVGLCGLVMIFWPAVIYSQTTAPTTQSDALGPGNHFRSLTIGQRERHYLVHVPKGYKRNVPSPVVLALHGAMMNGPMMAGFSGLNATSEKENFIVVYPSGTGTEPLLTWNAGGLIGKWAVNKPDDVDFISRLLDDLATLANVDTKRVYACGMSNGAMMCYRLAAELSNRIAAIAPVAGTITIDNSNPSRPVPVIHFHGTMDGLVPFDAAKDRAPAFIKFKSVDDSIQTWVKIDGCESEPITDVLSKPEDEMKVTRKTYAGGKNGAEVVLVVIEGAGHTWPGQRAPAFLGKSALNISANDLIWGFFKKHPMK